MTEVGRKILERSLEMLPRAGRMQRLGDARPFRLIGDSPEELLREGGFCALGMVRIAARSLIGSCPSEEELDVLFPNGDSPPELGNWRFKLAPDGWRAIEQKFELWDPGQEFADVGDDNERFKLIVEEILLADKSRKETEK